MRILGSPCSLSFSLRRFPLKAQDPFLLPVLTVSSMGNLVPSFSGPSCAPATPSPHGPPPALCVTPRRPQPRARRCLGDEFSPRKLEYSSEDSLEDTPGSVHNQTMAWERPTGQCAGSDIQADTLSSNSWTSPSARSVGSDARSPDLSPISSPRTPVTGPYGRDAYLDQAPGLYTSTPVHG